MPVRDPACHGLKKFGMGDGAKVVGQISLDHLRIPRTDQTVDFTYRRVGAEVGSVAMLLRGQVDLDDGL